MSKANCELMQSQSSFLQGLLNSSLADGINHQKSLLAENSLQCLTNSVEAACCSFLLGKSSHAEVGSATVLEHSIDIGVEVDGLDMQVCNESAREYGSQP